MITIIKTNVARWGTAPSHIGKEKNRDQTCKQEQLCNYKFIIHTLFVNTQNSANISCLYFNFFTSKIIKKPMAVQMRSERILTAPGKRGRR